MRRYRKGQLYRPPSAAESAAIADVAEAYRRAPVRPQDYHPTGQIVEVLTPAGGIAARDGDTIYWELCKRCIHIDDGNEKTRVDTDDQVIVHNLSINAIAGDSYVRTGLTDTGVRYVLPSTVDIVLPTYEATMTFTGTGNFDGVINYMVGVTDVLELGDHHVVWDGGSNHFYATVAGSYNVMFHLRYTEPASGFGFPWYCDPAITNPAMVLKRIHEVIFAAHYAVVDGSFNFGDAKTHDNLLDELAGELYDSWLGCSNRVVLSSGNFLSGRIVGAQKPDSEAGSTKNWQVVQNRLTIQRIGGLVS